MQHKGNVNAVKVNHHYLQTLIILHFSNTIFPIQNTAPGDTRAARLCELAAVLNMLHKRTQTCVILRAAQNPRRQRETLRTDKSREKLHQPGAHQRQHKSPPLAQETDKRREGRAAMALHLF